jgi:branched-subunit amino acid transport protein
MNALLVLAAAGAISWLLRITFIGLFPAGKLPDRLRQMLEAAAPAALTALLVTELAHQGIDDVGRLPALVLGTGGAAVAMWRFENLALTALTGIAAYGAAAAIL